MFRLAIPFLLRFYPTDIMYLFPASAFSGLIALTFTSALLYTGFTAFAIVPIVRKSPMSAWTDTCPLDLV